MDAAFNGSFHFWPQLFPAFIEEQQHKKSQGAASFRDLPLHNVERNQHIQYWGAFVGFDRRPRDQNAHPILRSPQNFRDSLCNDSFLRLALYRNRNIATNLFFITAWNEWNEQAVLEPNDIDEFGYLQELSFCLQHVPAIPVIMASKQQ